MDYDHKQFLDLLLEYRSDETKKARRNVSMIAFVILAAALLGIKLTEINVFGLNLHRSSPLPVLLLTFALLVYWMGMFVLAWLHDREIQKERALLLDQQVAPIIKRLADREKDAATRGGQDIFGDRAELRGAVDAYHSQQERTKNATMLGRMVRGIEIAVPLALAALSFIVLAHWIFEAL